MQKDACSKSLINAGNDTQLDKFLATHHHVRLTHPLFDVFMEVAPKSHCSRVSVAVFITIVNRS